MTFHARIDSPLGPILLCSDRGKLTGLYFTDQPDCPGQDGGPARRQRGGKPSAGTMNGQEIRKFKTYHRPSGELFAGEPADRRHWPAGWPDAFSKAPDLLENDVPAAVRKLFRQTQCELGEYFSGDRKTFGVAFDVEGTPFQKSVWRALCGIPYGDVVSYGDVALSAGLTPRHGRPVGAAVGRNPITIIIPCHRVVSGSHSLTGYTGGLERKFALLELEGFIMR